jgi:hypothetical protein
MRGTFMRGSAALIVPLIAVVPLKSALAGLAVSVMPPILELSVPPGDRNEFTLTVKNLGNTRVEVSPAVNDLALSRTGAALPVESGEGAPSCAGWISMDLSDFTLMPGESVSREVVFQVPRGAAGGSYCVIVFEAREAQSEEAGPSLNITTRTGTIIMQTSSRRSRRSGEIVEVKTVKSGKGAIDVAALFGNTGEIHLEIRPSCLIRNADGRVIDRLKADAGTGTVLPGGMRQIRATWDNERKMEPGDYEVQMSVDFRGGRRVTRTVEFTIE